MFDGLSLFTNCTVVSLILYHCELDRCNLCKANGGDFSEIADGELAEACLRMSQLPPSFSKASRTAKMLVFLAVSAKSEKAPTFLR